MLDASVWAVSKFHLFDADDPRVVATMLAVETRLWVKTDVGGVARYEDDCHHRVSDDIENGPGNPWFICTLWLAYHFISRAKTPEQLKEALPIFEWAADHALPSGVLAEQVNPYTNEPISVSPLTWSHATVVSTCVKNLEKLETLQRCGECHQSVYRLRRQGAVEVRSHGTFGRYDAAFEVPPDRSEADRPAVAVRGVFHVEHPPAAAVAEVIAGAGSSPDDDFDPAPVAYDPSAPGPSTVALAIDQRDCIGCGMCIRHCERGVLKAVDGKAVIDLSAPGGCDLNGACVEVCPTKVVSPTVAPAPRDGAAGREVA